MTDLATLFQEGPPEKGGFLSRLFGIFNEQIIRTWARDPNSPYNIHERRPTLYENGRPYTLDFLFEKNGLLFVSEMKCEIQYQNYQFWRLTKLSQLEHHKAKKAFELFLKLSLDRQSVPVKAGDSIKVEGTVLVWGAATPEGIDLARKHYRFADVLTVESCISDLVAWNNSKYQDLLRQREQWVSELFSALRLG